MSFIICLHRNIEVTFSEELLGLFLLEFLLILNISCLLLHDCESFCVGHLLIFASKRWECLFIWRQDIVAMVNQIDYTRSFYSFCRCDNPRL
jgi:hypothetical protein